MSQENVEVVRRAFETINARDISGWLATCTADAELHDQSSVFGDVQRGHAEMRTWAEEVFEMTDYLRFEPQRFIEAGELVLVPVRISAMGSRRERGVPSEMSVFQVYEFSDGKIRRLWSYASEDEALEAVGLRE